MDYEQKSIELHKKMKGKIELKSKFPLNTKDDLSVAYTPGVAAVSNLVAKNPKAAYTHTIKSHTICVLSDGSAVLGLGNIGPLGALPVMEGKAVIFKEFGGLDAFPICVDTQDKNEIIDFARKIAPVFGGINLEDIAAPKCFEIEEALQDLPIPVMHDDQHGAAVVTLAALINSAKLSKLKLSDLTVVVNGAGAAGLAITKLLLDENSEIGTPVKEIIVCDSKGIINQKRQDLNPYKKEIAKLTNFRDLSGGLHDALKGAKVFIGFSVAGVLMPEWIKDMASDPWVFAMANPLPEIMPQKAKEAGAYIVGTGRSDFPNQINNALAFPGIFRGALDSRATKITKKMKIAAAMALANFVGEPSPERVLPSPLEQGVHEAVASSVMRAAMSTD